MTKKIVVTLFPLLTVLAAACLPVSRGPSGPLPTPDAPLWSIEAMAEHVEVLRELQDIRVPAAREAAATRYLTERLHEFMLQPAVRGSYVVPGDTAEGTIVMGYVAGRHPVNAYTGVLVWADLDLSGPEGGSGILAAAALLETARRFAAFARYRNVPERSLLFAIGLGGRGEEALRRYLSAPTWDVTDTAALVYLGREATAQIEVLAEADDLPVRIVSIPPASAQPVDQPAARVMQTAHTLYRHLIQLSIVPADTSANS